RRAVCRRSGARVRCCADVTAQNSGPNLQRWGRAREHGFSRRADRSDFCDDGQAPALFARATASRRPAHLRERLLQAHAAHRMETEGVCSRDTASDLHLLARASGDLRRGSCCSRSGSASGSRYRAAGEDGVMKYAFVNPNWNFTGSTYFGCTDPHYPLELLFAYQQVQRTGDDAFLIDAQVENLSTNDIAPKIRDFNPDFLIVPTAPSYL